MKTFEDLTPEAKQDFFNECKRLSFSVVNTAYEVRLYNKKSNRCFIATRQVVASDKLNMAFGGGSFWKVKYSEVQYKIKRDLAGDLYAETCIGKSFGRSSNGTEIYSSCNTKAEIIELAKAIGVFNI